MNLPGNLLMIGLFVSLPVVGANAKYLVLFGFVLLALAT
jgi:hypothetical protein